MLQILYKLAVLVAVAPIAIQASLWFQDGHRRVNRVYRAGVINYFDSYATMNL